MPMSNVDTAFKPELVAYCVKLGHTQEWLMVQSVDRLRKIAREDRPYVPGVKWEDHPAPSPAPTSTARPVDVTDVDKAKGKMGALIDALSEDLAAEVADRLRPEFLAMVDSKPRELILELKIAEKVHTVDLGIAHCKQAMMIEYLLAGLNVYANGPAGSGKTTACRKAAKAISQILGREIKFYALSCNETMQVYELLGHPIMDGKGTVSKPDFRKAYEFGGLFLADELDSAPGLITVVNMAVENGLCAFPDGMVERHPDFFFVGGGNTIGKGATEEYSSRQRQDAATFDRLAFIDWDYDQELELLAAGNDQREWVKHVQKLRAALRSLGASAPEVMISPRASINGAKLLRANPKKSWHEVEYAVIWKGATEDDIAKVRAKVTK